MQQSIAHDLGEKKAKQAITAAHRYYARRYSKYRPRMHWESRNHAALSFVATGMTVNATHAVRRCVGWSPLTTIRRVCHPQHS